MDSPNLQIDHTQLFYLSYELRLRESNKCLSIHPFIFLENYLIKEADSYCNTDFKKGTEYFKNLKSLQELSYHYFEYEMIILDQRRNTYLNEITSILIEFSKKLKSLKSKSNQIITHLDMLSFITKDILKNIFISFHLELSSENRIHLSKWFYLKEPVTSFRFSKLQEEKRLEILFSRYLRGTDFISFDTSFETFKTLFEGKYLVNKINWTDKKSSLYYFIKLLIREKIIRNTKNKHWLITSEFFLLKGETLEPKDFLNQKETQNQEKRTQLEKFISALNT